MATLNSIAEQTYRQIFPNPSDETKLTKEDFIASAKVIYASAVWIWAKEESRSEGGYQIPSHLLAEKELEVKNNVMDISSLKILQGMPNDGWLVNIGGLACTCDYVKSNINLAKVLCDDDSLGDYAKTYYPQGKEIIFPKGVHKTPLKIVYLNFDGEVEGALGQIVKDKLLQQYTTKIGVEDKTNNSNAET